MSLVVVTGTHDGGAESLAQALAERLGRFSISLSAIEDDLAVGAADTPRHWLRPDAELELVRLVAASGGEAVLAIGFASPGDASRMARLARLLQPWWADLVELRCQEPGCQEPGCREPGCQEPGRPHLRLGAPRTVVLDTSRPVALGDVVAAVRVETGNGRRAVRG